ncbi:MAG: hypothetical protein HY931_04335 [Candidatus Falkowbacteria bacterium]|nr:MAG: hypothetical protein HY931_04335 [Candidatus Falkowbacteria bacterium]
MGAILYLDQELMFADKVWRKTKTLTLSKLEKEPKFIQNSFCKAYKLNDKIEEIARELSQVKFSAYSNYQLADNLEKYCQLCFSMGAFIIFPLFIEEYLEDYVKKEVTKKCGAKTPEIIHDFNVSLKPSSTENDELSLLKIALKRHRRLPIEQDVKRHLQNYGWLKNSAMNNSYYSEKEIYRRLDGLRGADISQKIKNILNERHRQVSRVKKYQTEFAFSRKLINHIETLQEAIYFRSWRTERFYRNIQYLTALLEEISRRLGLKSWDDIFYVLPKEIINLLRQELTMDLKVVKERKRGYIMWADGRNTQIYSDNIVAGAKKKIKFLTIQNRECHEIKGQAACRGLAVGKVHIIKSKKEFKKFKVKEILVVPSTTPDYVPVMKKAAAIITDEGGLTCHAAIMSRELNIPCIIGTKIGTQVLRDGDLVEADAEKGIIKILKKA